MEKKEYRLKGHESFILRDGWLTKGLRAVSAKPKVFSENSGADALGVGTNMAKAIRYWLRAAGLTNDTPKGVYLTELGQTIFEKDPYFEDEFSLWLVHINIAKNAGLATSWNLFFNKISVTSFSRKELESMITGAILEIYGVRAPERSVGDDCAAILQMYAGSDDDDGINFDPEEKRRSPFVSLGLIKYSDNDHSFEKCRPSIGDIDPLLILYLISEELGANNSLPIDTIVGGYNMAGKILNLNRVAVNDYLDALQKQGHIIVNRTAGLDMVYPNAPISPIDAVKKHYERR